MGTFFSWLRSLFGYHRCKRCNGQNAREYRHPFLACNDCGHRWNPEQDEEARYYRLDRKYQQMEGNPDAR